MAKNAAPKFRNVMIRLPIERSEELDAAAKEIGLKPAVFACVQVLKALNARRGNITGGD